MRKGGSTARVPIKAEIATKSAAPSNALMVDVQN
jgi:hypothetical protein